MSINNVEQPNFLILTGHHKEIHDIHSSIKVRPLDGVYRTHITPNNPATYEGELNGHVYLGGIHGLYDVNCRIDVLSDRIFPTDYVGDLLGTVTLEDNASENFERGE